MPEILEAFDMPEPLPAPMRQPITRSDLLMPTATIVASMLSKCFGIGSFTGTRAAKSESTLCECFASVHSALARAAGLSPQPSATSAEHPKDNHAL